MTTHANALTARANQRTAPISPRMTASTELRVLVDAMVALGLDEEALLAASGLRHSELDDPDVRLPCETYELLVRAAYSQRFIPNLALRLAMQTPIGTTPLLDYLVVTSDDVGAGMRQLARYLRLTDSPIAVVPREDVEPIEVRFLESPNPFAVEYTAALIVLHLKEETEGRFAASAIALMHQPENAAELGRELGCPIETAASWNGLSIRREIWGLPLRRRDPVLRGVLERQAEGAIEQLPPGDGLGVAVRRALALRLAHGDTRLQGVARHLLTSPRTLQRRLSAAGLSFQSLLDDVRKEAAGQHVGRSKLSITEVAYLLGYSEPAPFHRAFKRWYGVTPQEFRRGRRATRPS